MSRIERKIKLGLLLIISSTSYAQWTIEVDDGFESYPVDERIYEDWWLDWNCEGDCAIYVSDEIAYEGSRSGYVPGDQITSAVLDLGNKIFLTWYTYFYMYIPSGKEASWNVQGIVPIETGESVIGNVHFNLDGLTPGQGVVDDAPGGPYFFDFPHDQWFEVVLIVDISAGLPHANFALDVDEQIVVPWGTPFTNTNGDIPSYLGGINFVSISPLTEYWIDDVFYAAESSTVGFDDHEKNSLLIEQNPIGDRLQLQSELPIDSITIYNMLGQQVYKGAVQSTSLSLDASGWARGTYTLEAMVNGERRILRFIK